MGLFSIYDIVSDNVVIDIEYNILRPLSIGNFFVDFGLLLPHNDPIFLPYSGESQRTIVIEERSR